MGAPKLSLAQKIKLLVKISKSLDRLDAEGSKLQGPGFTLVPYPPNTKLKKVDSGVNYSKDAEKSRHVLNPKAPEIGKENDSIRKG